MVIRRLISLFLPSLSSSASLSILSCASLSSVFLFLHAPNKESKRGPIFLGQTDGERDERKKERGRQQARRSPEPGRTNGRGRTGADPEDRARRARMISSPPSWIEKFPRQQHLTSAAISGPRNDSPHSYLMHGHG